MNELKLEDCVAIVTQLRTSYIGRVYIGRDDIEDIAARWWNDLRIFSREAVDSASRAMSRKFPSEPPTSGEFAIECRIHEKRLESARYFARAEASKPVLIEEHHDEYTNMSGAEARERIRRTLGVDLAQVDPDGGKV